MTGLAILQREIGSVSRKGTSYLLRSFLPALLVQQGFPIVFFGEEKPNLAYAFMRLTKCIVS